MVEGTAFNGSPRSGQFLRYVVEKAIAGHFESYIPEITREGHGEAGPLDAMEIVHPTSRSRRPWLFFGILFTVLNLALWGIFWIHFSRTKVAPNARVSILPWSVLFSSPHTTQLITSDPNLVRLGGITGGQVSVSDYANHNCILGPNKLTPEENSVGRSERDAASVDTQIIANVAELAQASSNKIHVHAARDIQLPDLKTDANFIFLGSPRSDPWSALFSDQLDFRFVFDKNTQSEFIRNVRPRPNEQQAYVPTAPGWATGLSFAIIALVQNPDQDGQVLLLAGADAEGNAAAGKLATDLPRLSMTLQRCSISPSGPLHHFELLLRLNPDFHFDR